MILADDIITKSRYTLSDTSVDDPRWSDNRLLSLLNDALLDIALTTKLYNSSGYIKLQDGVSIYDISNFSVRIERIEHLNKRLEIVSFKEMDDRFRAWQNEQEKIPTHIVYNLKKSGEFVVYPIPKLSTNDNLTSNSPYGVITDIRYNDVDINIIGNIGDLSEPNLSEYLKLYFIQSPITINSLDDNLDNVIDRTMISTISHYISAFALRDSMDTQNREVAKEELSFYTDKIMEFAENDTIGNVERARISKYRGME